MHVEAEEELDALAVGGEGFGAVAALDGAVEALVGLDEFGGHEERVVKLGEGGFGVEGTGVEDGLGEFFDFGFLSWGGVLRPRVIIVDEPV